MAKTTCGGVALEVGGTQKGGGTMSPLVLSPGGYVGRGHLPHLYFWTPRWHPGYPLFLGRLQFLLAWNGPPFNPADPGNSCARSAGRLP